MKSAERKFLHDVANPIATGLFLADALVETIAESNDLSQKEFWVTQLKDLVASLEKARVFISERRNILTEGDGK